MRNEWPAVSQRVERLNLGDEVWVAISDRGGRRLLNTSPQARADMPPRLPRPAGVVQAVRTGQPEVSNLFTGSSTGRFVVAVDRAVPSDVQQKVVSLVTSTEAMTALLRSQMSPDNGLITLVDRDYRVIARTRDRARFVGAKATPSMRGAMQAHTSGVTSSRSLDGQPTVVAHFRSPRTGWTTLVVVPRAEFVRPIARNAVGFLAAAALVLFAGLIAARYFGRLISIELRSLEIDAKLLGEGGQVAQRPGAVDLINTVQAALHVAGEELARRRVRQQIMINELNHRVKNTLASVQSIAVQTFRGDDPAAPEKFAKRLQALAEAHDLITRTEWTAVNIKDVVGRCGEQADGGIFSSGPSFQLSAQAALALCMCLHELTTNSIKYGALSAPAGRVFLSWTANDDGDLDLLWREEGGPRVTAPERRGFGTRLVDRLVKSELGGTVERDFAPSGLIFRGRFHVRRSSRWKNDFEN